MIGWVQHHLAHGRDLDGLRRRTRVGQMQRARLRIALHADRDTGVQITDGTVELHAVTQTTDPSRHRTDRCATRTPRRTRLDVAQDERQPLFIQARIVLPTGQQVITEPRAAGAGRGDHRPKAAFPENDGCVYRKGSGRAVHRVSRSQDEYGEPADARSAGRDRSAGARHPRPRWHRVAHRGSRGRGHRARSASR